MIDSPAETSAQPGNLPLALDSFVGRAAELTELTHLLNGNRLVTLAGPGGAGKTRLALELAARVRGGFPGGVWFVELAALTDGDVVAQAVAAACGVRERPGHPILESIAVTLGDQRMLLLLDNCEQVVLACAELAESLLRRCPGLVLLVTTREGFELAGERVFRVGEMGLPRSATSYSRSELLRSEAVRLFVERAVSSAPEFELTPDNADDVAGICRRLDGNPLAIELAARRVRLLPPGAILERLDDRFGLLTGGSRTAARRHQDLRAAIDWSYDLLNGAEQALFRRLSVLVGGFTPASASVVGAGPDVRPEAVLGLLDSLDAKSLVVPKRRTISDRFRQLESIRLYGFEQLTACGEVDATYEQLVRWLLDLVEPVVGDHMIHNGAELDPILAEADTLLHVAEWAAERGDNRQLPLAAALARSWSRDGYVTEGRRLLKGALRGADRDVPSRSAGLAIAAMLANQQGDHDEALSLLTEALALEESGDRPFMLYRVLSATAIVYVAVGDPAALDFARRAVEVLRPHGDAIDLSVAVHNCAWACVELGELRQAAPLIDECMRVYRQGSPRPVPPEWLHTAGVLALGLGDVPTAATRFREGLEQIPTADTDRAPVVYLDLVEGLARVAAERGEARRALRLVAAAEATRQRLRRYLGRAERVPLDNAVTQARSVVGASAARTAEEEGRRLTATQAIGYALTNHWPNIRGSSSRSDALTPRESDVAGLVAAGLTNRQIAGRLRVSERTVEAHLEHVRQKLDLRSRAQIAGWAVVNKVTAPG